jgi:hypothetical protein
MLLRLPHRQVAMLKEALAGAGTREIGGQIFGEQLEPSNFRITELTVQRRMGSFARFVAMNQVGLTWEDYCEEVGEPGREMVPEQPLGFVLPLVERLGIDDPDSVFARQRKK